MSPTSYLLLYSAMFGCGGRIRTVYDDFKVMSLASYQLLYPTIYFEPVENSEIST